MERAVEAILRRHGVMRILRALTVAMLLTALAGVAAGADQARKAFVDSWRGRRVEVKRTLYTLVYNERGRLGRVWNDKREGLVVVTPSAGSYLQFDGRDSEEDIVARDAQQVVDRIGESYRRSEPLEVGFYLRVEPLLVATYQPGGILVVRDVQFERNRVRVSFASVGSDVPPDQIATSLTVQWPTDLSPSFTERPLIEDLIRQFVGDRPSTPSRTESQR